MTASSAGASASAVLARIAAPERGTIGGRTSVVVAHPDDETLACGALLSRLADVTVVHVTDGAPRNLAEAARHGFEDWQDYAAARRRELEQAAAIAGIAPERLLCLGVADQGAAWALASIARRLVPLVADADLVLTHALEGGHPDHDAVAFAVRAAVALLGDAGRPTLVEMPLYRLGAGQSWLRQSFPADEGDPGVVIRLNAEERARKGRMMAAHRSQAETLAGFGVADEPYRVASDGLAAQPHGAALYDAYEWGVTSRGFAELAARARAELGLDQENA